MQRRHWLQAAAAMPLALPALPGLSQTQAAEPLPWKSISPRDEFRQRYVPDMRLRTHTGKEVRLYEDLIKDKMVMINFMYLNCGDGTCPSTTFSLVQVQQLLKDRVGKDLFMYSITIDPEADSVELLNRYAKSFRTGPGWTFLRAEPKETEILRKRLGFTDRDPKVDAKKSNHVAMIRYGNEPTTQWGMASAMATPAAIARMVMSVDKLGARRPPLG